MFDTVVLDGNAQVNINQNVDVQVVTADASGAVTITTDGDGSIILDTDAELDLDVRLDGEYGVVTEVHTGDLPYYTGPTEVTPAQQTQVLQTAERAVSRNIIINPIPSNYGLVTWDGATLTVS